MILSTRAESIIPSAPPAESTYDALSAAKASLVIGEYFFCGEGQTKRPRAFNRGNGWAHSAGSSTVDHDKWLQVGYRNSDLSSRGSNYSHPPRLKIAPNTRRVAPKWPLGRGLQIASNKKFKRSCHHAGQEAAAAYNASRMHANNDGSQSTSER
jgi:hypothetical protein